MHTYTYPNHWPPQKLWLSIQGSLLLLSLGTGNEWWVREIDLKRERCQSRLADRSSTAIRCDLWQIILCFIGVGTCVRQSNAIKPRRANALFNTEKYNKSTQIWERCEIAHRLAKKYSCIESYTRDMYSLISDISLPLLLEYITTYLMHYPNL